MGTDDGSNARDGDGGIDVNGPEDMPGLGRHRLVPPRGACTATEARNLQATQDGDLRRIHGLQKLMLRSWSNTLIHTSLNCSTVGSGFITRRLNGKRVRRLAVTLMADDPRRCSHAATRHFSQDDDLDDEDSTQQSSRC